MGKLHDALMHHAEARGGRIAASDSRYAVTRSDLAGWVAGAAAELGSGPEVIGILGENSVAWAVAFLAACASGKTIVPIPTFFSGEQLAHLVRDSGMQRVLATDALEAAQRTIPLPVHVLSQRRATPATLPSREGGLIIYTSGSTGRPKGVRLCSGQALWSAEALASASGVTADDKYLSMLPLPMLLEQICGVMIPALSGGAVHYETTIAQGLAEGAPCNIAEAAEREQPTMTVLVPQLLALYTAQLAASGKRPPESLRFVAVGGAPTPPALAAAAAWRGIPVYEGYGLSECSSVLAVNRPGASRPGTVGRPLEGLRVDIEDGEIVVEGPSVMDGYLHRDAAPRRWRTGDLGQLDADGFLTVHGRRDNLIVTAVGRNISPEWIETMLLADLRIGACIIGRIEAGGRLAVLLVPSRAGEGWFRTTSPADVLALVTQACRAAPVYARPTAAFVCSREEAAAGGVLTPNGRVRRAIALAMLNAKSNHSQTPATHEVVS